MAHEPSWGTGAGYFETGRSFFGSRETSRSTNVESVVRRLRLAVAIVFVGCGAGYTSMPAEPGAIALADDCLDVQVFDGAREPDLPRPMPVLGFRVGNRCRHPVPIDFGAIEVAADVGGRLAPLRPHDPRRELGPASLDGRAHLEEHIAYELPVTVDRVSRVCVRLDGAPACLDVSMGEEEWDE